MPNDQDNPTNENRFEQTCFTLFGREKADLISAAGGATLGGYVGFQSSNLFPFNDNSTEATLTWVLAASGLCLGGACVGALSFSLVTRGIREIFKCLTGYQRIPDVEGGISPSP